jgi:hypothetical protein
MKKLLRKALRRLGWDLVPYSSDRPWEFASLPDLSEPQRSIIMAAKPFTMTTMERMAALISAVTYVTQNQTAGDIAECGVWRGGSMIPVALTLLAHGDRSRSLYLFDTFEGMTPPDEADRDLYGVSAGSQLKRDPQGTGIWCYASLEDVRANMLATGYPKDKIHFLKVKVEDTLPVHSPASLAILRLDTDWYESTRHELIHLYPLLRRQGVLILDDYGHWRGARKAVDEYFAELGGGVYLHRIDYAGRLVIKTDPQPVSGAAPG